WVHRSLCICQHFANNSWCIDCPALACSHDQTRLQNESEPVEELTFTSGVPIFMKISAAYFF
ncbi:MAG: hypothetical protein KAI99_13095, partial [Cyclobacteriaceae bacterium]|nr:hypothetical protein [Cyclobacteriaceae bacterium]